MPKFLYKLVLVNAILIFLGIGINNAFSQVITLPLITTQPSNATVIAPATATFKVVATGAPAPTYQWMLEAPGALSFMAINGATKASYTTVATTTAESGTQYECVVTNAVGHVTSNAVTLTVNPAVVPTITTQPSNATVIAPATATFKVVATGAPVPTYQWMQEAPGAASFTVINGATKASYTTAATTLADSGTQFECVVNNQAGNVTSNAAILTVNPAVAPTITTQPSNATVIAPATATFKVVATGTPAPTYQWMQEAAGAASFTVINGATKASYTTAATTLADSGTQFECVVTNQASSVASNAATLTVNPAIAPSITTQPVNATVIAPATATFKVVASGAPAPKYQWMIEAPGALSFTNIAGATGASYTTPATTTANSGTQYECVVINVAGSVTSNAVTLTVNPTVAPTITTQPVNKTVTATLTANFSVVATGAPAPKYQWMIEAPGAQSFTNIVGATGASYTTPATTTANSGTQYECVVINVAGSVTSNAVTLTVNPTVAPTITTQPVNKTITATLTAKFSIVATGAPAPTYQWQIEAPGAASFTNIAGATGASYTTPATTTAESGTLYECVVTNVAGSVTSNAVTLTVNPTVAPAIKSQPVNKTVTATLTAKFSIVATGAPAPTYQWQIEAPGAASFTNIAGATGASYTTPATTTAESGTLYECVVTNAAGSVTSNAATLTVNTPPSLPVVDIVSPANNNILVSGSNLPIVASASEAGGTISSVSFYNGATLLGTTTTIISPTVPYYYIITNLSTGTYTLTAVATDANGVSATSSPITLTINPLVSLPVVAITSPANNSVISGSNLTIIASAGEAGGTISYVSFYDGNTFLGSSTTSPYSYTLTNPPLGTYTLYAVAMDANGNSITSNSVIVTVTVNPLVVNIASPANQSTFTIGSINITAIASENSGTISNVAFYNGATLLGTVTSNSQAYTYRWTNIPAGSFNLTAVATDSTGATNSSSPITVTINSSPFTYAIDDNVLTMTDALNHTSSYQYDNLNRLLQITFADGSTVAESFDLYGNQINVTDQRGNTLTKTYDAYDRLIQAKDPLGGITQFNYDTTSHLLTLTDANGNLTSYSYDGDYRVLTQTNALNFITAFAYDLDGNVITRTDANGKATNYTYDALNRLTNKAYPDGTSVAYVYDALGHRTSMTDSTGQTTYAYDALSRLLSKTSPGTNNSIAYTYDSEGNRLTSVDQNNRTITNTYDTLNRLASVADPNGTTSYDYDAVSNELSLTYPNGVTESYTYDTLNRVLTAVNAKGATVISSFSDVYDIAGMITKKTLQDGSWTAYSYDALNRLLEETKQTSSSIVYDYVYTYDPVGNRLTWTKNTTLGGFWNVDYLNMPPQVLTNMTSAGFGNTANPTQTTTLARNYTYDAANRLINWNYGVNIFAASFSVQTDTYTYDQNGNRLTKQAVLTGQAATPQQTSYAYDFENRLNQLNYVNIPNIAGTQMDSLIYNGEGLRTQAVLNNVAANYLYDGFNILNERDGSGNTTKIYTRGLDFGGGIGSLINQNYTANGNAVTQYYDYTDLGSTADLTTTTGSSASSYQYDAFGNLLTPPAASDTNRYLFSTKEFDSRSGLQFFGYRYYDPEIGRWLTPDPLGFVNGLNKYAFNLNNPVNFEDAWGLNTYFISNKFNSSTPTNSIFSHSFIAITQTDWTGNEVVIETFSWTNQNGGSWNYNIPENIAGAQNAIDKGTGAQQFGNKNLDSYIEQEFQIEANDTGYDFGSNNCKERASQLISTALYTEEQDILQSQRYNMGTGSYE